MPFWDWDDIGPDDESSVRRLPIAESLRRLAARMRPYRGTVTGATLLILTAVAAELIGPLLIRRLIDHDIPESGRTGRFDAIVRTAGIYLGLLGIGASATYLQSVMAARMGLSLVRRLKQDMFRHLLDLSADFFDHNPPGRLLARVESDSERLQVLFSEVTLALVRSLVLLLGTVTVMLFASPAITIAVLGLVTPFFVAALFFMRWMRPLYGKTRGLYSRLSTFVTEYAQAVPILQVYGRQRWALDKLDKVQRDRFRAETRSEFLDYGFWSFFFAAEVLAVMLILYLGFARNLGGALTLGTVVLFVEYTRRLFFPIVVFTEQLHFMQKAFASADRVFSMLESKSQVIDHAGARTAIPRDWKELALEKVSFDYRSPEGGEAKTVRAIENVSFRVRRGERIALVGPSGGGKSTLTNLLLRFYQPTSGRITLDGADLRAFEQKAWRDRIGLVLQDIHLFPGTVAENLQVFRSDLARADLERAFDALGERGLLDRLPQGLDTPLSEGGQNLSMGERQIISFARALVRDPDLLILDEATSSIDPATERKIQESLERLLHGRTSVIVAHRLSTITAADRILVMQRGRLIEEGTHAELLRRGGVYAALFDLQFRVGEPV